MDGPSLRRIAHDMLGIELAPADADSIASTIAALTRQYRVIEAVALPPLADSPPTPHCGDHWLKTRAGK